MTTQNVEVVSTDVDRGLILIRGAVPGSKGAWILVRDAVKDALPDNAPKPAGIRAAAKCRSCRPPRERNNGSSRFNASAARMPASSTLSDEIFGLEPRDDILQRIVRWQLAKRQQGTHQAKGRAEIARTGAKMYKQKGTGRARHHSARAPQFRGGGKAHGPVVAQP